LAAVLAAGVNPLVRAVFGFDAETSSLITWTTRAYLLTLTGFSIQEIAARSFYARKEPMFPLYAVMLRLTIFHYDRHFRDHPLPEYWSAL
jgi:peptidoglycan biosynthesis protein MviN/MurJ (putative lipid II flippase)